MNAELISVIVPAYNVEQYLDRCITSIVQQTYSNLEIILVDDGSTDRCPEMCDRWTEKDDRIRVIHKENGGISSARNSGLQVACGELISFIDSDDYIDLKMLETMMNVMRDEQVGIVECGLQEVFADHVQNCISYDLCMGPDAAVEQLLRWTGNVGSAIWNKLFRRTVLEGVEFCEDLRYGEDTPFLYQALKQTTMFVQIPFIGYYHLMREDSLVGKTFRSYKMHSLRAAEMVAEDAVSAYPQLAEQAHCHVMFNAFSQISSLLGTENGAEVFSDEYAICIQTLRKGNPAILKKYMSTKRYALYQFCCKTPTFYQVVYCAWQKMKRKYHG